MRVLVAAIGKARPGPARDLYEEYAGRLSWPLALRELELRRKLPAEEAKRQEGVLLLGAVPQGAVLVALDERGRQMGSEAFAARIGTWRDAGAQDLAFVIGGADGLDPAVTARADLVLALGAMTWPHMMVRAMLAEQLYRAQTILAGHPYHRA
ncbi:23S rRNA (pseudouridine(1915)-N(3))-methyltransferase RlmH [Arenibaculum pallidiluteum]|uniref:23S rRNA (pseudouridine(1915)-N(3))-methyltransferase RlmH n=1 Tax=Arenibaculum pallidiluteum TaxID=2812559 RepID=UPI001A95FF75|nr:23S rRNA (pseudouridine(1915)-N(3))-methyltransferase RlmH [Arenibaculum pallidiluteum]